MNRKRSTHSADSRHTACLFIWLRTVRVRAMFLRTTLIWPSLAAVPLETWATRSYWNSDKTSEREEGRARCPLNSSLPVWRDSNHHQLRKERFSFHSLLIQEGWFPDVSRCTKQRAPELMEPDKLSKSWWDESPKQMVWRRMNGRIGARCDPTREIYIRCWVQTWTHRASSQFPLCWVYGVQKL